LCPCIYYQDIEMSLVFVCWACVLLPCCTVMPSANRELYFSTCMLLTYFSCLIGLTRTSSTKLNRVRKIVSLSSLHMLSSVGFLYILLNKLRKFPSVFIFLEVFFLHHEWVENFFKFFFNICLYVHENFFSFSLPILWITLTASEYWISLTFLKIEHAWSCCMIVFIIMFIYSVF
jgi:hypothetical protein